MKYFVLLVFCIISVHGFTQTNVDSLLKVAETVDQLESCEAYLKVANSYNENDELDSTLKYAEKALKIAQSLDKDEIEIKAYFLIGNAQALKTKYEEASQTFFSALRIAEKLDDKMQQALIIKEIGYVFMYTGNSEKAIEYFNKMYDLFVELGDKQKAAYTLGSIGTVYYSDSNNVEAVKYFDRGLKIANELGDPQVLQFLYSNIGLSHFYLGNQKLGTDYVLKSYAIAEEAGSRYHMAIDLANLTHFEQMKGNYEKALGYGLKALPMLRELNLKNPLRVVLNNLHGVYYDKGDLAKAYQYQKEYYEVKSEIETESSKKEAEIQELSYASEKDKLEIANLNKDLENERLQRLLFGLGALLLALIGGGLWYVNRSLGKKNALIEAQKSEIQDFNNELEQKVADRTAELQEAYNEIKEAMAKGQTLERKRIASDLHDNLGSVISAINFSLSGINPENLGAKQKEIYSNVVQMTDSAYSELRNLSHNLLPEKLEKEGLVNAVEQYLESLNAAQPVWFDFTTNTRERFSKKVEVNLYAVIMECCNNILKHAQATEADITIQTTEHQLQISIQDDGVGFDPTVLDKGKGLKSIKERIEGINGDVKVSSDTNGTQFLIEISKYK